MGRTSLALIVLLGLALAVRLVAAGVVQRMVKPGEVCLIAGDAEGYWLLARTIVHGQDYAIFDPPRYVLRMPGLPIVLAACQVLFGENLLAARIVLALLGTLTCGLVYWLGHELFDHATGLVALTITAVWPTMVLFSVLILSETLFAGAMIASLITMARVLRASQSPTSQPSVLLSLVTGLLIAVTTYQRPTWLPLLLPLVVAMLVVSRGRAWRPALLVIVGCMAFMAPWMIRNYHVTGHPVATTLWSGPSLYDGLHPGADGSSHMEFVERDGVYQRMSEYDANRYYRDKAVDFAWNNPARAIELGLLKLGRYWNWSPNAAQFQHPVANVAMIALFVLMMGLAATGTVVAIRSSGRDVWTWVLPLTPLLYFALLHVVFVGSLRYRLPAEYPLAVLTAVGGLAVVRRLRPGML